MHLRKGEKGGEYNEEGAVWVLESMIKSTYVITWHLKNTIKSHARGHGSNPDDAGDSR